MKPILLLLLGLMLTGAAAAAEPGADHPLVGRFEGSTMVGYKQIAFDEFVLLDRKVTGRQEWGDSAKADYGRVLEGEVTRIGYLAPKEHSTLEVMRAYKDALEANGFEILFACSDDACGGRSFSQAVVPNTGAFLWTDYGDQRYLAAEKARPVQGDVHVAVYVTRNSSGGADKGKIMAAVHVVEAKARESEVVLIKAGEMAEKIGAEGKVALYGLYFDTNEATIKAESKSTLDQIATLLKDNPELKLFVVGHTDNQGGFEYNMDLSKRRAAAVVGALVGDYGIAAGRLEPAGVGFLAPVASNATEAGRAKNRRVELVAE